MESLNRIIMYVVIIGGVYLLYRLLLAAYQAHGRRAGAGTGGARQSIRAGSDTKADLLKLALSLLPGWLQPGPIIPARRIPTDQPGITEVFILYFDMLSHVGTHGHDFRPAATPQERLGELQTALPQAPVASITNQFNAACYGNIVTDPGVIDRLRGELDGAIAAA